MRKVPPSELEIATEQAKNESIIKEKGENSKIKKIPNYNGDFLIDLEKPGDSSFRLRRDK